VRLRPSSGGLTGRRRLVVLAVLAAAVVAAALVLAPIVEGPGRRVETGIVVGVEATSLTSVQGFSIRTTDGRTVDFRVGSLENGAAFPPGHLTEHKVSLTPIRVTYVDTGGAHVAVMLEDAP
jgi:hypothetical protein